MTEIEMYHDFRRTIDELAYPALVEMARKKGSLTYIKDKGEKVGFLMIIEGYVEGIYVKPDCRGKGLARKAVVENYDKIETLCIVKNNDVALKFWHSVLKMEILDVNEVDVMYRVTGLK